MFLMNDDIMMSSVKIYDMNRSALNTESLITGCGYNKLIVSKNISGIRGSLTSPGYPGNYPNNVSYTWTLDTGHEKATVDFTFDVFDIDKYHSYLSRCADFLEVLNKLISIYKITEIDPCCFTPIHRCGQFSPFPLTVRGRLIRINFVSDGRHTARGFSLAWIVSRPASMKITTQATPSTTTTQKSTTRTTKPPELTTITPRKETKFTTRTIFIDTTTQTTKMQRETTLRTTAQKSTAIFYSTKKATTKINLKTTPTVLAKKISIMKETPPESETFDPSLRSTNQLTTKLENRHIPTNNKTTTIQNTDGYIFVLQLTLNGLFLITIVLLGLKLKTTIHQRRESPHIYTGTIETPVQESGHYLKFKASVSLKEEKVVTIEESLLNYFEPIPVYVDVI
ncbi:uncharacterized protein LOC134261426 [Saccostrea cucullata]|uniref:uncharacterized protein LOC134261426 n=1 Tax=Saccostrea cuccullata TaxID=36930 RepID=UPI002ED118BD